MDEASERALRAINGVHGQSRDMSSVNDEDIVDRVTDLLILAERLEISAEHVIARARMHCEAEVSGLLDD